MPDASLKDMANRMALQGERVILKHGGGKVSDDGKEYYLINTQAEFVAPLEFPAGPRPLIEVGTAMEYDVPVFGGEPPFEWAVKAGDMPDGLAFADGTLSGTATTSGVFSVTLQVKDQTGRTLDQRVVLVVREENLARTATEVIASAGETDTARRDVMWLTVARSLYADRVEDIIRDGTRLGNGSTFYSITSHAGPKDDAYGYEWEGPQTVGLVAYHTGSMEENGGWFTSLNVEYRDEDGDWKPVKNMAISPPLPQGNEPFNKPHFVEYLLTFEPVETTAVRMVGSAGGGKHWNGQSRNAYFTSITELSVHGPLLGYELLEK
jgi:hypothetical protein